MLAWLLLMGLLVSQGGLVGMMRAGISVMAELAGAHRAETPAEHASCNDAPESGCQERCPGDSSDGTCPIGCHDCTCCSGRVPALIPAACAPSVPVQAVSAQPFVPEHPVLETYQRIFRPPRPEPVC